MSPRLATLLLVGLLVGAVTPGCGDPRALEAGVVRFGHFPNLTHAHGLVGHAATRAGKGWFEERLPPGTRVEWYVYPAGPNAMQAMLAGSLDLCYVGPSPALNAHLRSRGSEVRVVAGAARGGAALVTRPGTSVRGAADFRGRQLATPQLGSTQDVAARAWLAAGGLRVTLTGGDARVVPIANSSHLDLFLKGEVDGAWTVEPWVSRLELDGGGSVLVEETEALTTVLVSSVRFLAERRDDVRRVVAAHEALSAWLEANPAEAKARVQGELREETGADLAAAVLERAWGRLRWQTKATPEDFASFAKAARALRLLPEGDVGRLVEAP
jgi:NitT/TauT family transport system substrate-binding protein